MRRIGTETWAGIAMLVLSIAVSTPIILGLSAVGIPRIWWTILFVVFLAAVVVATAVPASAVLRYVSYAVAVACGWGLILGAQHTSLVLILLVVTAAIGVYLVPLWVSGIVVATNTLVIFTVAAIAGADGTETTIIVGFYLLIQAATVLSSATLVREQRLGRELAEANVDLRAAGILLSESARTEERLRISRELHDLIGHQLTVLTLELETARHVAAEDVPTHLDRADRVARDLLRDVRVTVGQLRTEAPDLERVLHEMTEGLPGLELSIDVAPGLRIGEPQSAALVRAAQEIVTNTLRHAEARELWIEVSSADGTVTLRAQDDGSGAQPVELGNGLLGLRERLTELGGELVVDGRRGFAVTARMPAS